MIVNTKGKLEVEVNCQYEYKASFPLALFFVRSDILLSTAAIGKILPKTIDIGDLDAR